MAKKKSKTNRKSSRRKRKPKYLSLRLQFSSDKSPTPKSNDMPSTSTTDHHQLHLEEDENMAYLLSAVSDGGATTFTDLIGVTTASSSVNDGADDFSPSASITNYYEAVNLVRTAFRNKLERDRSEERYVRYSEVVERRDEEVNSRVGDGNQMMMRLSLKLDYEEIMNAWSDKGPLYIQSDLPQTVPDINDDFFSDHQDISSIGILNDGFGNGSGGGLWRVPEGNNGKEHQSLKMKAEVEVGDGEDMKRKVGDGEDREQWKWKVGGQREASLLRYKEKRRSRLFSKTIRYHVRKLNAEKRPRVKGRFVKRS